MKLQKMMVLGHAVGRSDVHRIESLCADALRSNPKDLFALMMLAETYWRDQRPDDALLYALRALEVDPKNFHPLRIAAGIYAERGVHDRAYSYAKHLATADPPIAPPAKLVSRILKPFSWLSIVRRIRQRVGREDNSCSEWYAWAKDYVSWYESQMESAS